MDQGRWPDDVTAKGAEEQGTGTRVCSQKARAKAIMDVDGTDDSETEAETQHIHGDARSACIDAIMGAFGIHALLQAHDALIVEKAGASRA